MKNKFLLAVLLTLIFVPVFSQTRSFTGKPMYQIMTKRSGNYLGTTTVELFPSIAPLAVNNFDSLVSVHFYDSTAFHRVIPGFMIQGGDPNSRHGPRSTWGMGDPSQPSVNAEFSAARHVRGTLSAARDTGINSANSQFFICVAPASWLNGQYTIYGRVIAGMDIVDTIVSQPRDANDNPYQKIEMFITYIGDDDTLATVPTLIQPANYSFSTSTFRVLKWVAQTDGIIYHVDVSTDSTFATTYRSIDIGTNQYTVTGLHADSTYYWRVNSNNGGNVSNYSPVWTFNVSAVGIEEHQAADPVHVSPNPGSGQFLFTGLSAGNTMEIYDVSGRTTLKTTANGNSCSVDLADKAKGVYFYSVIDHNKVISRGKLVVE